MDLLHDINKLPLTNTTQIRLHKCRLLEPTQDGNDKKRQFQDSYFLWRLNFREDVVKTNTPFLLFLYGRV